MKKEISLSKLKKKAWDAFSQYIRLRTAYPNGNAICITCGKVAHWRELQAGHFIDGRGSSVLFHEELVHSQCVGCNVFKKGNKDSYTPWMIKKYGISKIMSFYDLKKEIIQYKRCDYERILKKYEQKAAALLKNIKDEL